MYRSLPLAILLSTLSPSVAAAPPGEIYYDFLNRDVIGADTFTQRHRTWDGRGVVIAVLDTGVDPSVPGLRKTSTGKTKVIEARDFSGEGDVTVSRTQATEEGGVTLLRTDDGVARGVDRLPAKPSDGVYWMGFFDENDLERSSVDDVNRNGRSDDRFAVVAFYPKPGADPVVVIDLDGDGDLSDENLRPDYRTDQRHFVFANPDPRKDQSPIAFTVTVMPEGERRVEFHFDDGGHGTHCAGIASGYGIQGRKGFDGIAPGAWVMSLKIGNNALAGGATTPGSMKKAIDYASRWAKERKVPVVMNISYGVGSEIEGYAGIDTALDEALAANGRLVASVAAGNDGPGLSTVGTPGAAHLAWTAGAYLDPNNGKTLWGGGTSGHRIFGFSSRGGEIDKPDGLSPGVAWSSVPPFHRRAVMAGTSMATPQAAGALALLVSAATQSKTPWNSGLLKRALRSTAKPVRGYARVDQGAGLIQVGPAFKALKEDARDAQTDLLLGWKATTPIPHRPGYTGTASYWRTGHYVPGPPHTVAFDIEPIFLSTSRESERTNFFADLSLRSSERWLDLDRSKVGIRGESTARVTVRLDPRAVSRPGLHEALITATPRGSDLPAIDIPVVVVTPERFDTAKTRYQKWKGTLPPGGITRRFIEVPPGATALDLRMKVPEGRFGSVYLNLYDPEGRSHESGQRHASSKASRSARIVVTGDSLTPGVWELVPYASFRNHQTSAFEVETRFIGLSCPDAADYFVPDGGGLEASIDVTNRFEQPIRGAIKAAVIHWARDEQYDVEGPNYDTQVVLGPGTAGATLSFELSPEDYNLFTDIAVNVVDQSGGVVAQSGFGARYLDLSFHAGPGTYSVEILGATALPDTQPSWGIRLEEVHHLASPLPIDVTGPDGPGQTLYPGVRTTLDLTRATSLPERPDGFYMTVEFTFEDQLHPGPAIPYRVDFNRP